METQPGRSEPRVFNIRIWNEDLGGGHAEWRGRVFDADSGEARYFRDWPTLLEIVTTSLAGNDEPPLE